MKTFARALRRKLLPDHAGIQLREAQELWPADAQLKTLYDQELAYGNLEGAVNLLRYAVLWQQGGVMIDPLALDLAQPPVMGELRLIPGTVMAGFPGKPVDTGLMAAPPGTSVISRVRDLLQRRYQLLDDTGANQTLNRQPVTGRLDFLAKLQRQSPASHFIQPVGISPGPAPPWPAQPGA